MVHHRHHLDCHGLPGADPEPDSEPGSRGPGTVSQPPSEASSWIPTELFPGVVVTNYYQFMASSSTHLFSYKGMSEVQSRFHWAVLKMSGGQVPSAGSEGRISFPDFSVSSSCLYSWAGGPSPIFRAHPNLHFLSHNTVPSSH